MPELPEVETICRGLAPVMTGQTILRAVPRCAGLRRPFPRGLGKALEKTVVRKVARRAKYILIHLDNGQVLVLHLGMSGRVRIESETARPQKHDHFTIHLKGGRVIVLNDPRRFGAVFLAPEDRLGDDAAFRALGPEPLSRAFDGPALAARLKGRRTAIKTAIMDQRIVVGVGNIYASEALFMAGIDPRRLAGTVTGDRADRLARAIRTVLNKAIRKGGSTLRDHRRVDGAPGYFQHHFSVYDREGQACPGCSCDILKTKGIRRIVQGGRSSFYCAEKQT